MSAFVGDPDTDTLAGGSDPEVPISAYVCDPDTDTLAGGSDQEAPMSAYVCDPDTDTLAGGSDQVDEKILFTGSILKMYNPSFSFASSSENPVDESMISVPSIEILPDECLIEIFTRLPLGEATSSSACVSKHWLMLLSNMRKAEFRITDDENVEIEEDFGYLSRSLEGRHSTDVRLSAIAIGVASRGGLGKLMIKGSTDLVNGASNAGLTAISHYCHSLRALCLWDTPLIGDQGLLAIANGCPKIENIEFYHCKRISNYGLAAIAENCHKLTYLLIHSCPWITDEGIISLIQLASMLRKLKIHSSRISDISLAVIGHYGKSLESLILGKLPFVSPRGFWLMGMAQGLKNLVSLTISSCNGLTDESLEAIGEGCSKLKQISLKKCWFVSDYGMVNFAIKAASLKRMSLEKCHRITQFGIIIVIMMLKSLTIVKCMGIEVLPLHMRAYSSRIRSLSIINCPGFGNIGLICNWLRDIDFSGSPGITTFDLMTIIEQCKAGLGLVNVNLKGCLNVTDRVVSALAYLHGNTIEELSLEDCPGVSDISMAAIADKCTALNELDLSRCLISDYGIAVLSLKEKSNLMILSLSGCCNVTDASMPFLEKLGQILVGLNLKNCPSISGECLDQLVDSLERCDILS